MYSAKIKYYGQAESAKRNMSFDEACTAFFNWKDAVAESATEYCERVRKLKLIRTFKLVIENELTQQQKEMLALSFLEGKSGEEIAAIYKISRSTACRNLMKINSLIKEKMKYVFEYADMDIRNEVVPAYIEAALSTMTCDAAEFNSIGERLKKARERKLFKISTVSGVTGIAQEKIERIENGASMSLDDFVKLITFYKVGADQIIFGV